eukprot:1243182-Amphidinium_carterae.2
MGDGLRPLKRNVESKGGHAKFGSTCYIEAPARDLLVSNATTRSKEAAPRAQRHQRQALVWNRRESHAAYARCLDSPLVLRISLDPFRPR